MSAALLTNQKLFIKRMTENQEQAKWGFEILLKRPDFADFFDHLRAANLFSPEYNSDPVPAEDPGYVQIPYWSALDYLEEVAKQAGDKNDIPVILCPAIFVDQIADHTGSVQRIGQLLG